MIHCSFMKKILFFGLLLLVICFSSTCKKEFSPVKLNNRLPLPEYNWSEREKSFFSLDDRKISRIQSRSDNKVLYHPLVIEAYSKIIQENEIYSFVDDISQKVGIPFWEHSFFYYEPQTKNKVVLVPLAFEEIKGVRGLITLTKKDDGTDDDFIINAISRQDLLDTSSGNAWQKSEYAKWMMRYDYLLFDTLDNALKRAYCAYKLKIPPGSGFVTANPNGSINSNSSQSVSLQERSCNENASNNGCEWRLLEVCVNTNSQYTWFNNSTGPTPNPLVTWFDGDHDDDGTPDQEDEDYYIWIVTFKEWVHEHGGIEDVEETFDGDHDNDGISDGSDVDWEDFLFNLGSLIHDIGGWFGGILDWFGNLWGDIDDWWDRIWDDDRCWDGDLQGNPVLEERTIICDWFYVLDCGAGSSGSNWFNTFENVVPCPMCPEYEEYHDIARDRLFEHYASAYMYSESTDPFWSLYNLSLEWDCNAYSPCYEDCIDQKLTQFLTNRLDLSKPQSNWLSQHKKHELNILCILQAHKDDVDLAEDDLNEFLVWHISQIMNDPEYEEMITASFGWPAIVWTIGKDLLADKAVDFALNLIPFFAQKDELRDAIKAAAKQDWAELLIETGKIVLSFVKTNVPWLKLFNVTESLGSAWYVVDKINDLANDIGTAALERSWNILKNSNAIRFSKSALKYVEDIKVPKFGNYFATVNSFNPNFKAHFTEVGDQIGDVHHAVPQWVLTRYQHLGLTPSQIHSLENLRGIPNNGTLDHPTITNYWEAFYNTNPNANYDEVIQYAKFIDDEFGHLFIPPVR